MTNENMGNVVEFTGSRLKFIQNKDECCCLYFSRCMVWRDGNPLSVDALVHFHTHAGRDGKKKYYKIVESVDFRFDGAVLHNYLFLAEEPQFEEASPLRHIEPGSTEVIIKLVGQRKCVRVIGEKLTLLMRKCDR